MALKLTAEQKAIDRELNRINRQIRQAYKIFGRESRLAQQYETLLYTGGKSRKTDSTAPAQYTDMVRYTKEGVPQLARSAKAIRMIQTGSAANAVMQLGRMQTVQSAQKAMAAAYERRTGQKVKSRADMAAAVQAELNVYQTTQGALGRALTEMYRIERERGIKFKGHEKIAQMSKGRWTSQETLQEMAQIAQETIQNENAEIISQQDRLAGY